MTRLSGFVDTLFQDIRFGIRTLARKPGFTSIMLLTLTIGTGASIAMFSIVDATLLRPLPFREPERLMAIWESNYKQLNWSKMFVSYRDFQAWRDGDHDFESMAAYTWAVSGRTLSGWREPRGVTVIPASADFFSTLGVKAEMGRTFEPGDESNPSVVVLSHSGWVNLFAGSPGIVGETISLDRRSYTVIGVMPRNFQMYPKETQAWSLLSTGSDVVKDPMNHIVAVVGRLKAGVSKNAAVESLAAIRTRADETQPDPFKGIGVVVNGLQEDYVWFAGRNLKSGLLALFGAVLMVLLIGCLNVASLLLGRGSDRRKEMAVRCALGSGRPRLIRQLLTESVILSSAGAGLGILLAESVIRWFNSAAPVDLPPDTIVVLNARALVFSAGLAIVTGVFFGIVPAFEASRPGLNDVLKESGGSHPGSRPSRRYRNGLVVAEIALALVLTASAALLVESSVFFARVKPGFQTDHLLTLRVALPSRDYSTPDRIRGFYSSLLEAINAVPGVKSASAIQWLPIESGGGGVNDVAVEGRPAPAERAFDAALERTAKNYFQTMGIPLIEGRLLNELDSAGAGNTGVVSQAFVREYFPGEDPLGKRVRLGNGPWTTIVGVVGDVQYSNVFKEMSIRTPPILYRPSDQEAVGPGQTLGTQMSVVVRTAGAPERISSAVITEVRKLDSNLPAPATYTMDTLIGKSLAQPRLRAAVVLVFSGLALFLAALGVYGVVAHSVAERTHELGVRMALGASRSDVLGIVIGHGLLLSVFGTAIGLCGALATTRLMTSLLYGTRPPNDPSTLVGAAAFLIAVALGACYIPARRATGVDPSTALRYQ